MLRRVRQPFLVARTGNLRQTIIKNSHVVSVGDALFHNAPAQTYRWLEESDA
jgi:hypothetical protein